MYFNDCKYAHWRETDPTRWIPSNKNEWLLIAQNDYIVADLNETGEDSHPYVGIFYPTKDVRRGGREEIINWINESCYNFGIKVVEDKAHCMM